MSRTWQLNRCALPARTPVWTLGTTRILANQCRIRACIVKGTSDFAAWGRTGSRPLYLQLFGWARHLCISCRWFNTVNGRFLQHLPLYTFQSNFGRIFILSPYAYDERRERYDAINIYRKPFNRNNISNTGMNPDIARSSGGSVTWAVGRGWSWDRP